MVKVDINLFMEMCGVKGELIDNGDGTYDAKGDVIIPENLANIPVKFRYVSGKFDCSYTQITSLEGAPEKVGGHFSCTNTQITSLKGAPREVGGDFICKKTPITSLKGAPKKVGGNFRCFDTETKFTKDDVRSVSKVNGGIIT